MSIKDLTSAASFLSLSEDSENEPCSGSFPSTASKYCEYVPNPAVASSSNPVASGSNSPTLSDNSKIKRKRRRKSYVSESDSDFTCNLETEKEMCNKLGIEIDDEELKDIEEDDRIPVDNVIDDILNLGMGIKRGRKQDEKLYKEYQSLSSCTPLEITEEARLTILKNDVETVKKVQKGVDALISVLAATRDKLVRQDNNLVYTQPPTRKKRLKKLVVRIE